MFFLDWLRNLLFSSAQKTTLDPQSKEEKLSDRGIRILIDRFTHKERRDIHRYISLDGQWPSFYSHQEEELNKLHSEGVLVKLKIISLFAYNTVS
jgi:hypothetical protein